MPTYRNNSSFVKTFYGVEFKPGEVHTVPGFINAKGMNQTVLPSNPSFDDSKPIEQKKSWFEIDKEEKSEMFNSMLPENPKRSRGRKPKSNVSIEEFESKETILSENTIEEGEENG